MKLCVVWYFYIVDDDLFLFKCFWVLWLMSEDLFFFVVGWWVYGRLECEFGWFIYGYFREVLSW